MNPWLIVSALVALMITGAGGYYAGARAERNAMEAQQAHDDKLTQRVQEAAQKGAAQEIAKIEVKHVTIRQQTQIETRDKPVYRECVADDRVFHLTNEAITGLSPGANPGSLPGPRPADR